MTNILITPSRFVDFVNVDSFVLGVEFLVLVTPIETSADERLYRELVVVVVVVDDVVVDDVLSVASFTAGNIGQVKGKGSTEVLADVLGSSGK